MTGFHSNRYIGILLIAAVLFIHCSNGDRKSRKEEDSLAIAVAANMQFAMDELVQAFTEETGIQCKVTISSSGKLTAQIKQGAPFDVFVSANMKYPNVIYESGLAEVPPKVYAHGKLVLWTMKDGIDPSPDILPWDEIRHIAMANPETAPYGEAALDVIKDLNQFEKIRSKLVYGESIAQTNQFIITESAEIGFTAMSVVMSPQLKNKGKWVEIQSTLHRPIEQGVLVINREGQTGDQGRKFYDFLSSERAKKILESYGYNTTNL
ncbi:MAG: molybdate ABC transporter substrate-binding protein [Saprospiraceae bacterium]|nr:molybdate ABC transporter substrate-binding protein [Saprospiraceae bacterium]